MTLMTRRWFMRLLPFGVFGRVLRTARAEATKVVSVVDYGAVPGAADSTAGIAAAIAQLPKRGGATLLFPPGVYNLGDTSTDDVALRIDGVENLTIDGRGATLNFRGKILPAAIGS